MPTWDRYTSLPPMVVCHTLVKHLDLTRIKDLVAYMQETVCHGKQDAMSVSIPPGYMHV
jgi:hypothetical protein